MRVCVYIIGKGWSVGRLTLFFCIVYLIDFHLFRCSLINYPTSCRSYSFPFIPLFLEYHTKSLQAHRAFDRALTHQHIADLCRRQELSHTLCGDIEKHAEQLFLVVLCAELVLVLRHLPYLVLLEPVGEAHLYEVPRLRIHPPKRKERMRERTGYALHLKRQPTAVTRDVAQKLALVAARAERRQAQATLLGITVGDTTLLRNMRTNKFAYIDFL